MEKLTFTKVNDHLWESQAVEVAGTFNVHLDRAEMANCQIMIKTSGSNYANGPVVRGVKDVDVDFVGEVWPKTVKVISGSAVTDGEINEK